MASRPRTRGRVRRGGDQGPVHDLHRRRTVCLPHVPDGMHTARPRPTAATRRPRTRGRTAAWPRGAGDSLRLRVLALPGQGRLLVQPARVGRRPRSRDDPRSTPLQAVTAPDHVALGQANVKAAKAAPRLRPRSFRCIVACARAPCTGSRRRAWSRSCPGPGRALLERGPGDLRPPRLAHRRQRQLRHHSTMV